MLKMIQQYEIHKMYNDQNCTISEISDRTGHDRKTIRKCVNCADWGNAQESMMPDRAHKIDPYKDIIEEWLLEDQKATQTQRFTALQIYIRLKEKYKANFDCSYLTVAAYVKLCKERIYTKQTELNQY